MAAGPSNSDLQRQILGVKNDVHIMSAKLDKALEHSAAHKARLDNHDSEFEKMTQAIADLAKGTAAAIGEERQAREGQFLWVLGAGITGLISLIATTVSWALNQLGGNKP